MADMLENKLLWVALPLLVYALLAWAPPLRRRLSRHLLNVHVSLLLLVYLCVTAGLGVFWVANQQLPVFDWHYLFGYATLLLVVAHLSFNFRIVVKALRRRRAAPASKRSSPARPPTAARRALGLTLAGAGMLMAFLLGARHGSSELKLSSARGSPELAERDRVSIVERYHEFASASETGVFARAPGVDWGQKPAAFKNYPDLPFRPLKTETAAVLAGRSLSAAIGAPAPVEAALTWQTLGALLYHTVGVTARRSGYALRAAPSSGGLFPTELYVRALGVAGVDPGLYHYAPETEHLERLEDATHRTLGLSSAAALAEVPIAVVLTSVFRRTGHKYRDRAYRYAVADAGHALENLRLAASEAGLFATPVRRFDEQRVSQQLGLDDNQEGVLALVLLSRKQPQARRRSAHQFDPALARIPESPSLGVTGWVHRATSLRLATPAAADSRLQLPPATDATQKALDTIRARRSQRRFTSQSLTARELSSLLSDVHAAPWLLSPASRVHVVIQRVAGIQPGVYRYDSSTHSLLQTRRGDHAKRAEAVAIHQEVIGRAAAVFVFSVDTSVMFREGARGYRHAFLETGLRGERLLLSAVARGLGACPVGAFYDDAAAELLDIDPRREWVVHFAAVGRL